MGPTRGPPGSCRPQMGPMLATWTLLSGFVRGRSATRWLPYYWWVRLLTAITLYGRHEAAGYLACHATHGAVAWIWNLVNCFWLWFLFLSSDHQFEKVTTDLFSWHLLNRDLMQWVWARPMREDVTMKRHLSLAEPIPIIIIYVWAFEYFELPFPTDAVLTLST